MGLATASLVPSQLERSFMERIWELKINSSSSIREVVARLQYELLEANRQGREILIEIWKENGEPDLIDKIVQRGGDNLSQLHEELVRTR